MKKRQIAIPLVMLVIALTGCAEKVEEVAVVDENPVTIKTVSMFGGSDPNAVVYEQIKKEFQEEYDYIIVLDESSLSDEEWKTSVAADFSAGNEPDVLQFFTDCNANQLVATGKFVSIEEIREVYPEYAADTYDWALEEVANTDGVMRAVPTTGYWEGLYCNRDLFVKYRVEVPYDWDTLVKAIETFRDNGVVPIACSLNNVPHYWMEYCLLYAAGEEGYETIPEEVPEDWIKGLEQLKVLRDMGAFPLDTDTVNNDYVSRMFQQKKAAMQLEGNWYLAGVPDQTNTIVVPFPGIEDQKGERGMAICGMSSGFYITRKAWENEEKRDAAVKYVMAQTSREAVQRYWANGGGVVPAATAVTALEEQTPLAGTAMAYYRYATASVQPTDARIDPEAYKALIAGMVNVSNGGSASELLEEVLEINRQR